MIMINTEIDLVEIGIGNIGSVKRCLERLGVKYRTVGPTNHPDGKRPLVLPGVGQFGAVMQALKQNKFDLYLRNLILAGTPYLGICVGLQILFENSEESPNIPGLGLLKGKIVRFRQGKIPQIGWNLIKPLSSNSGDSGYAYFVNSYYAKPQTPAIVSHTANYHIEFCAAVQSNNITAVQFHPEKSAQFGNDFLEGWLRNVG